MNPDDKWPLREKQRPSPGHVDASTINGGRKDLKLVTFSCG
jgi:hypothetical protein